MFLSNFLVRESMKKRRIYGVGIATIMLLSGVMTGISTVRAEEDGGSGVVMQSPLSYIGPTIIVGTAAVCPVKPATIIIGDNQYVWTDYYGIASSGGTLTIRVYNEYGMLVSSGSTRVPAGTLVTGTLKVGVPVPPYQEGITPIYTYRVTYQSDNVISSSIGIITFAETRIAELG